MQILCQLGGLPTTCLSNNDHYVVVPEMARKEYLSGSNDPSRIMDLKDKIEMVGFNDDRESGRQIPDDVKKLLSDCKYRQVLSLFQKTFLLSKLTASLSLFFHVFCKFLLSSIKQRQNINNV